MAEPNPNYITPEGARRLTDELARLGGVDRPHIVKEVTEAAAQGDRSENAEYIYGKKKLREIDRRMRYLRKRLEIAVIVDPSKQKGDKVFFGATVELEDEGGTRSTHQIVGEDEIDTKATKISWRSPIGRALLGKSVGDVITVRRPAGEIEIEILSVRYG
ncbi:MAG: transcription elongation factor GreB [Byssovorax sp.]